MSTPIPPDPSAPRQGYQLNVLGIADHAHLWATALTASGWRPFTDVENSAGNRGGFSACACAQVGASGQDFHVVGVSSDGRLWHAIQTGPTWPKPFTAISYRYPGIFVDVACAAIGDELHVIAVAVNGQAYYTIRHPDDTWRPFRDVEYESSNPGPLDPGPGEPFGFGERGDMFRTDCAGVGEDLHIVAITGDGRIWHAIRFPDDSWQPFNDVEIPEAGQERGRFWAVGCAGIGEDLHVCGRSTTPPLGAPVLWHAIRHPDSWQPFGPLPRPKSDALEFDVACAADGPELHVCLTTDTYESEGDTPDWRLWHRANKATGWTAWGDVEAAAGELGSVSHTACAIVFAGFDV